MKTLSLSIVLLLSSFFSGFGQYWFQSGGSATIDEGTSIAVDGNNNIYTTGYFTSIFTMSGNQVFSSGLEDIFITKMNPGGYKSWLISAGGVSQDRALSIDADNSGNIVITGYFYGTTQFGSTTLISDGQQDIFIAKYDTSGNLIWAKRAGGTGSDIGNAVKFDNLGNIIVSGEFSGTCNFSSTSLTSQSGTIDAFVAKYDPNGNVVWAKSGSGKFTDRSTSLTIDDQNQIYVYGMFSDTIAFDNVYANTMQNAAFIIKLNPNGADQWFRWLGSSSSVNAGGINYSQNGINVTGSFSGTLFFFGVPGNPSLSPPTPENIFVARYNLAGALEFNISDGSDNPLQATSIASTSTGNIVIGGNFKCKFKDYSNQYGDGVFRSMGFWDTYVASYDIAGNWIWARHYAGKQNDLVRGLAVFNDSLPVYTGSYENTFVAPIRVATFTPHGTINTDYYNQNFYGNFNYCSDNQYGWYTFYQSKGNSDVYINAAVDIRRQPLDYFSRSAGACNRIQKDMCISNIFGQCLDTMSTCSTIQLNYYPGNGQSEAYLFNLAPTFNINWSSGATAGYIITAAPGVHTATATSIDGCFTHTDSVFLITSFQYQPAITDNKGINTNTASPDPINLCIPDSVQLNCVNAAGNTVTWSGFPIGTNPVYVSNSGIYSCVLTNSFGCTSVTDVIVNLATPLSQNVLPALRWMTDSDGNDSLRLCENEVFPVLLYDEISNPGGLNIQCIPEMTMASWDIGSASPDFNFMPSTTCSNPANLFTAFTPGIFNLVFSVEVVRINPCGHDTLLVIDTLFVEVFPSTNSVLNFNVIAPDTICPGQTTILVASPPIYNYVWTGNINNDTLFNVTAGSYNVSGTYITVNSYGCIDMQSGSASITIDEYPQPSVSLIPSSGIICPNDSVMLQCSGTTPAEWYGPSGIIATGTNSIYSTAPGNYYCTQNVASGCNLVSNTISLYQYSSPALLSFPDTVCLGDTTTLTVIASPGSTISWQSPLFGSAATQQVSAAGNYFCEVTSCGIVSTLSIGVNVFPAMSQPVISFNPPVLTSTTALFYQWLLNGVVISGANGQDYTPTNSGSYSVVISDVNGCTSESLPFIITDVKEINSKSNISIVPNPANTHIRIIISDDLVVSESDIFTIHDAKGKIVMQKPFIRNSLIDISNIANGVYFVEIISAKISLRKKLVVQH